MNIGDLAPGFALLDHNKKEWKLFGQKFNKILLSFHPLAWTKVCSEQMISLEKNKMGFDNANTMAFGLSVDSVPCKNAWAKDLGILNTPLLSDFWPHGKCARGFGIFREADGFSERANIILDRDFKVIFFKVYPISELPDINELMEVMREKWT